ncbi:MaoC family dehydratase N-terminal domain-containing protein [Chloroflexota bacterium]
MSESSTRMNELQRAIGNWKLHTFLPEEVTVWSILKYINALKDPNPIWRDDDYAKKTRWDGVIAPPTFVEVYSPINRALREISGEYPDGELRGATCNIKLPFDRLFAGGEEFEFFIPIRPGDAISCDGSLGDVYEKQGSSGGSLVFVRLDKEYHNQRGELIARTKWIEISAEAAPQPEIAAPQTSAQRAVMPTTISPEQVCFEDVEVGTLIPSMEKLVSMTMIAMWAVATGDVGLPHFDHEYMKNVYGIPNVIAHGPISGALLAQLITNWIGGWGALKKHSVQYRGNIFPGNIIKFMGRVVNKYVEQGENFVECETWAENQAQRRVTLGKSLVTLPSKDRIPRQ